VTGKRRGIIIWLTVISKGVYVLTLLILLIAYLALQLYLKKRLWVLMFRFKIRKLPSQLKKELISEYSAHLKLLKIPFVLPKVNISRRSRIHKNV
jgi:hypothetical protein